MKRRLLLILLLLLGGAIVNVAVAWGFAAWARRPFNAPTVHSHPGELAWIVSSGEGFGITWVSLVPHNKRWKQVDAGDVDIPRWSRASSPPTRSEFDDLRGLYLMEFATGWPLRSGRATVQRYVRDSSGAPIASQRFAVVSGIAVLDDGSSDPIPYQILPLRAIWPGFAINTLFYAAILWLLFAAPFALRRRRRIKRGLCVKCAYDLRKRPSDSSVCPECGAPAPLALPAK